MRLLSYTHHLQCMKKKPIYNTLKLPYLQSGKVAYYDLHDTLLTEFKEFTIHCNHLLTEKKIKINEKLAPKRSKW